MVVVSKWALGVQVGNFEAFASLYDFYLSLGTLIFHLCLIAKREISAQTPILASTRP